MKITHFEKQVVFEAAIYLKSNTAIRRQMVEACGMPDPDMYPEEHTGDAGRMMDYGHKKSDSHEGRMTKAKLFRLAQMAQRLHDKMVDDDDLPEWVQDKVTTAEDRLKSAHDYITYKIHRMNETISSQNVQRKITRRELRKIIQEEKNNILNEQRSGAAADFETGSVLVEFAQQYAALGNAIQEQINEVIAVYLVGGGFPDELEEAIMQQNPAALQRAVRQLRRPVSQMANEGFEEASDLLNAFNEIETTLRNI